MALLPYWPGAPSTATDAAPHFYERRIPVVNDFAPLPNLDEALAEWNHCHADVRLVHDNGVQPYTRGSITITHSEDGAAYGGVADGYGVVFLGDGWTRAQAVIAHEVGHALGFGHAKDQLLGGFTSVMAGGNHVSAKDCEGLRRYYGLG